MQTFIRLPWPPTKTSPNASGQGKWRDKSSAAKAYKQTCAWECRVAKIAKVDCERVDVEIMFFPPANFKYDLDNMLSRTKQGLDAVAEAIGVDDSQWQTVTLKRGRKVPQGAVRVAVTPAGADIVEIPLRGVVS